MGWFKIGDLFTLQMGKTPARSNSSFWGNGHTWVSISDLSNCNKYIAFSRESVTDDAVQESGIRIVPQGTLIMSFKLSLGKTAITASDLYTNEAIMAFIDKKIVPLDINYVYHLFSNWDWSRATNKAVMGLTLNKATLSQIKIPIPSLETQKAIANILDKIDESITLRKRQLELFNQLVKSRFLELFGDPLAGNAKWPIHNLCMVADAIDPQPSHRAPPIDKNGIPYISIKDCDYNTGKIDFEKARKVNVKVLQEQKTKYQIHNGDMMIGKIGTIGYPVFLPTYETYTLSANVILIQPNKSKVQPCFLKYSLESPYVESQFDKAKHSTSQSAFGILKIRKIKVMNPELSIQNQFADFVNQVDKSKYQEVSVTGWRGILICCNI